MSERKIDNMVLETLKDARRVYESKLRYYENRISVIRKKIAEIDTALEGKS